MQLSSKTAGSTPLTLPTLPTLLTLFQQKVVNTSAEVVNFSRGSVLQYCTIATCGASALALSPQLRPPGIRVLGTQRKPSAARPELSGASHCVCLVHVPLMRAILIRISVKAHRLFPVRSS